MCRYILLVMNARAFISLCSTFIPNYKVTKRTLENKWKRKRLASKLLSYSRKTNFLWASWLRLCLRTVSKAFTKCSCSWLLFRVFKFHRVFPYVLSLKTSLKILFSCRELLCQNFFLKNFTKLMRVQHNILMCSCLKSYLKSIL